MGRVDLDKRPLSFTGSQPEFDHDAFDITNLLSLELLSQISTTNKSLGARVDWCLHHPMNPNICKQQTYLGIAGGQLLENNKPVSIFWDSRRPRPSTPASKPRIRKLNLNQACRSDTLILAHVHRIQGNDRVEAKPRPTHARSNVLRSGDFLEGFFFFINTRPSSGGGLSAKVEESRLHLLSIQLRVYVRV